MLEATELSGRRHGGPAAAPRRHRQRPGEREHDGLQAPARRLPRPRLQQTGRSSAQGVRTGAGAAAVDAGRAFAQGALQRTDQPARRRHPGRGLPARQACRRPPGAHARRQPARRRRRQPDHQHRRARPAADQDPRRASTEDQISIGPDGTVTGRRPPRRPPRASSRSARRRRADSAGDNAFVTTAASGAGGRRAARAPSLTQGALEASNVDVAEAMVEMIESQRAFQLASKAIPTADQMMGIANGVKR